MTTEQNQQLKRLKADAIARCINIISVYFQTYPEKVISANQNRDPRVKSARIALFYHLHKCGMSWAAIGKIWGRKEWAISNGARVEFSRLDLADRKMVASLPSIPNSLKISKAQS